MSTDLSIMNECLQDPQVEYMKMKPAVKKRWLAALRGKKYKQCQEVLHDGVGFCCLGVVYDIEKHGGWEFKVWVDFGIPEEHWTIEDQYMELSPKFMTRIGVDKESMTALIELNDGGFTFYEIADWIEEYL